MHQIFHMNHHLTFNGMSKRFAFDRVADIVPPFTGRQHAVRATVGTPFRMEHPR